MGDDDDDEPAATGRWMSTMKNTKNWTNLVHLNIVSTTCTLHCTYTSCTHCVPWRWRSVMKERAGTNSLCKTRYVAVCRSHKQIKLRFPSLTWIALRLWRLILGAASSPVLGHSSSPASTRCVRASCSSSSYLPLKCTNTESPRPRKILRLVHRTETLLSCAGCFRVFLVICTSEPENCSSGPHNVYLLWISAKKTEHSGLCLFFLAVSVNHPPQYFLFCVLP